MNCCVFLRLAGLVPKIKIRQIQGNIIVVNNAEMTELGDGIYNYDFGGFDKTKDYAVLIDKGPNFEDEERFYFGGTETFINDIALRVKEVMNEIWDGYGA